MNLIEMFSYPFMQRALIAGIILAILLGWLGVFVVSKRVSFVGDGIAHASLAAVALAILLGWAPLPVALVFAIILAVLMHLLERKTNLSSDAAIGILFSSGMAIGVLLLQFHDGYVPELVSYLFGNILAIGETDLGFVLAIGSLLVMLLAYFQQQFIFLTVDPEGAMLAGIKRNTMELLMTVFIALTVVLSIQLLGIVLVSALLVIPSSIGKTLARSFLQFQTLSIIASLAIMVSGLVFSFIFDLPSGATIVVVGTLLFFIARLGLLFRK